MSDLNQLPPETASLPSNVTIAPFSPEDDAADQQAAKERSEAFSAPITEWNGIPLSGFSISRETLWLDLRHAAHAPPWHVLMENTEGHGTMRLLPDTIRILYILSRTSEECERARQNLLRFESAANEWAEQHLPFSRRIEAIITILDIYNASQANVVELVTEGTGSASLGK